MISMPLERFAAICRSPHAVPVGEGRARTVGQRLHILFADGVDNATRSLPFDR